MLASGGTERFAASGQLQSQARMQRVETKASPELGTVRNQFSATNLRIGAKSERRGGVLISEHFLHCHLVILVSSTARTVAEQEARRLFIIQVQTKHTSTASHHRR